MSAHAHHPPLLPPSRRSDQIDGNEEMRADSDDESQSPDDNAALAAAAYDAEAAQAEGTHLQQHSADAIAAPPAPAARRSKRARRRVQPRGGGGGDDASGSFASAEKAAHHSESAGCCVRWLGEGSSVLWLFTLCQLMIFYDRGMVAGFLPSIQSDLGTLSDTQMGLLGSGFIFGYMIACPLFAFFSKSYSAYKLMSIGLFLWVNAVTLCGLTDNFITLLGARILTGVGEASFAGLAPTCIDDVAPLAHRTIWLSFFFSGVPIGSALGYISGGWFASAQGLGWHYGFLTEALCMAPMVVVVFLWPNHTQEDEDDEEEGGEGDAEAQALMQQQHANQAAAFQSASTTAADWRLHRNAGWQGDRLHAEPPHADSAFYDSSAEPAEGSVHPPPALLHQSSGSGSGSGPLMNRSISTPALRRLDDPFHHPGMSGYAAAGEGEQQSSAEDASFTAAAGGDDDDEKHSGGQNAPPPPEVQRTGSGHFVSPIIVPPSPAASSAAHHRTSPSPLHLHGQHPQSMRGARTPSLRSLHDQQYITPDPDNPFHAPGQHHHNRQQQQSQQSQSGASQQQSHHHHPHHHSRAHSRSYNTHVVSTPGPSSVGWNPRRGVASRHLETLSLPSPGSFNPHYASLDPQRYAHQGENSKRTDELFVSDIAALLTDGVYIVVVLGYAALAFVIGALSFWAPVDFSKTLHISIARSTQIIGLITFSCGLGGTFFGGWCLDKRGGARGIFAVISALELCCCFVSLSIVFALGAVLATDLTLSMVCLALADFFLFGTGAPVNAALLSVAPRDMRSLAMAMSILLMHALGDLPSPFLMGYITDEVNSIQLALVILCLWLLWTVLFWCVGVALARRRAEAFKNALRQNMSRPVHERTALLGGHLRGPRGSILERRGSTGQFYSQGSITRTTQAAHNHAAAGYHAGMQQQQQQGPRRYRPFEHQHAQQQYMQQHAYHQPQAQYPQQQSPSPAYQHHPSRSLSSPSTPTQSNAPRRSRSVSGTPLQSNRRMQPQTHEYAQAAYADAATTAAGYGATYAYPPASANDPDTQPYAHAATPSRQRSTSDLQHQQQQTTIMPRSGGEFKQQPAQF